MNKETLKKYIELMEKGLELGIELELHCYYNELPKDDDFFINLKPFLIEKHAKWMLFEQKSAMFLGEFELSCKKSQVDSIMTEKCICIREYDWTTEEEFKCTCNGIISREEAEDIWLDRLIDKFKIRENGIKKYLE